MQGAAMNSRLCSVLMIFLIILVGIRSGLGAAISFRSVRTINKFSRALDTYRLIVVMFYDINSIHHCAVSKTLFHEQERIMRSISKDPYYRQAKVQFFKVNIGNSDGMLLRRRYGIKESPTYMIFYDGEPVENNGYPIRHNGFVTRTQLKNFIDQYALNIIDDIIKDEDDLRKKELELAQIRAYNAGPYFYSGGCYPCAYPWYPYNWYGGYDSCRWGFGCGFYGGW
jgi:hypothetical protein